MNPIRVALAILLSTITGFAQGQVNFANRVGAGGSILNAPVTLMGTSDGPGPAYSAQLYLVGTDNSLTPLTPLSTFNPPGAGAGVIASQFWAPQTVTIPGHFAGETLIFRVRAWKTADGSFDSTSDKGQSDTFAALLGGASSDPNTPPSTPANLLNLKAFVVGPLPEPSTVALGLLGVVGLVVFRRGRGKSFSNHRARLI